MRQENDKNMHTAGIEHRIAYEHMQFTCIRILSEDGDFRERLQRVIDCLQTETRVSRVYVFENEYTVKSGLFMTQICESCAEGIAPQIENQNLQHVAYADAAPSSMLPHLESRKPWTSMVAVIQYSEFEFF